jgi:rRNA maturation endonuclease Nob1
MIKPKEIYTGWKNLLIKQEDIEQISAWRMDICNECPKKIKQLNLDVCGECGCPLMSKSRSPESQCPLGKW